jgi:hypothetical protein
MARFEEIAKQRGYKQIKIKTRNDRREMINYLAKTGWNFLEVTPMPNLKDNRILLCKDL